MYSINMSPAGMFVQQVQTYQHKGFIRHDLQPESMCVSSCVASAAIHNDLVYTFEAVPAMTAMCYVTLQAAKKRSVLLLYVSSLDCMYCAHMPLYSEAFQCLLVIDQNNLLI